MGTRHTWRRGLVVVLVLLTACGGTSVSVSTSDEPESPASVDSSATPALNTADSLLTFCEEAPKITSGRRVTAVSLDDLFTLVDEHVVGPDQQVLEREITELQQDLTAFEAGTGTSFDAGGVNTIIGRLCILDLESEAVES